jgi:ABC-type spermidine/putrescine transport system permease subunit II
MGTGLGRIQSIVTPRRLFLSRHLSGIMPVGMIPLAIVFAALLVVPIGLLILYSFWTAGFFAVTHVLTLDNYALILGSPLYAGILLKTLGWSLLAAAISTGLAYGVAYAVTFRLRRWGPRILVLIMASLLSSYIVRLYALTTILGTHGLINQALMALGIIAAPLGFLLYGYFAIVIALVYVYLPMAVLPIYAAMQGIDRRLIEASRDLGHGPAGAFWSVTLPLSMRGVRTAFAFCFILSASDYVAPRMVGGMSGQMIGAVIADQFGGASNFPLGAALSVCMVLGFGICLGALSALERLAGHALKTARRRLRTGKTRMRIPDLPYSETLTAITLIFLFTPLLTVLVFSFNTARNPGLPLEGLTVAWYVDVLQRPDFHRVLITSLLICGATVAGGLVVGVPAALALARHRFRLRGAFNLLVFAPMAMPGVVLGVSLMASFIAAGIRLGTLPTAAAHILLVTPFIVLVVRARLEKIPRAIEEAGRDLGGTARRVLRTITQPLLAPSLLGAGILAAAISLDELLVTNFTIGAQATVPVWISSQMRAGLTPSLNAVAMLMLAASLLLIGGAALAFRRRQGLRLAASLGAVR